LTILIIFKNSFTPITTRGDVIQGIWKFYADGARHDDANGSREDAI
jgi:hypothetical protein